MAQAVRLQDISAEPINNQKNDNEPDEMLLNDVSINTKGKEKDHRMNDD